MKSIILWSLFFALAALSTAAQSPEPGPAPVALPHPAGTPKVENKTPAVPLTLTNAAQPKPAAGAGTVLVAPPVQPTPAQGKLPLTPPAMTNGLLGKTVVYGGYFTDVVRAEKKRPLFDLRTPLDPQKDLENLSFYPGSPQVQGVILFSIKF